MSWDPECDYLCARAAEPEGEGRCYYTHCLASNKNYDMYAVPGQEQGKGPLKVNMTIDVKLVHDVNVDWSSPAR